MNKIKINFCIFVLFVVAFFGTIFLANNDFMAHAESVELITTRIGLINAIIYANDGDTILVGDIDFNMTGTGAMNEAERITIDKSVMIKNGKESGQAMFVGGSFLVFGTKVAGKRLFCGFEGIQFDGGINTDVLVAEDWNLSFDERGELISQYPIKAQYAASFRGNVHARFSNCSFSNYMFEYGGAINAFYGDYSQTPKLLQIYGDNASCELNLDLSDCNFYSNAALYGGGAISLQGNKKNIMLNAEHCRFQDNSSAVHTYSSDGGAIYAHETKLALKNCVLSENEANRAYNGLVEADKLYMETIYGGALFGDNVDLVMTNCVVLNNSSSNGGGLALTVSSAEIKGCRIMANRADTTVRDADVFSGPSAGEGIGGGLYFNGMKKVSVVNTTLYGNRAKTAYGGVSMDYTPLGEAIGIASFYEFLLCTIVNNTCDTRIYEYRNYGNPDSEWFSVPGNIWSIPTLVRKACIVIDESFDSDFPNYEKASAENNYNYCASPVKSDSDGYLKIEKETDGNDNIILLKASDNGFNISAAYVKMLLGNRFQDYAGNFHIGRG